MGYRYELQLKVVVHGQWCVVTESGCLMDGRHHGTFRNAARCDLIVQPPANIFRPRLTAITPPRITIFGRKWMQPSIDVNKLTGFKQLGHPGAFLGQETAVLAVAFEVFQVNFLMGDINVSHKDEFAA